MSCRRPQTTMPRAPGSLRPGDHFGRYQLLERIGKGGMAEVFRAVAQGVQGFEREFVVKRIRPDKSDSPKFVQMFCEEARISALLHHPNIVQVYDFGHIDGAYFMVMEHLVGKDLSTVMRAVRARQGAVPPSVAVYVAREAARALHHAHTLVLPDGRAGRGGPPRRHAVEPHVAQGRRREDSRLRHRQGGGAGAAAGHRRQDAAAGGQARVSVAGAGARHAESITVRTSSRSASCCGRWSRGSGCSRARPTVDTLRNVLMQPIAGAVAPPRRHPRRAGRHRRARARARSRAAATKPPRQFANELDRFLVEMPMGDQAIPQLLEELFSAAPPPKRDEPTENPSATTFANGGDADPGSTHGTGSRVGYRTIPPPQPPRMSMFTLIGIFALGRRPPCVTVGRGCVAAAHLSSRTRCSALSRAGRGRSRRAGRASAGT